jgi:hypothetical protein
MSRAPVKRVQNVQAVQAVQNVWNVLESVNEWNSDDFYNWFFRELSGRELKDSQQVEQAILKKGGS